VSAATAIGLRESYRHCAEVSRREAKNFYYSFLLLPPALRRSMCALYAFMRHTDDLADEDGPVDARRAALRTWRHELDAALSGEATDSPILPALADAARRHAIPARYLHEVLDGVEMDLEPRPFLTFDDLRVYCYRVASAVGLCCVHIWGYRSSDGRAETMAESCGLALQLTNIIRDVREDASKGRVYLPLEDLQRFGVAPEELATATLDGRIRSLLEFQASRAYDFYEQAHPLVRLVEPVGRPMLRAITGIYRSLLDEIVRRDYDVLTGRVSLSPWRKAWITTRSLAAWPSGAEGRG
jgi:phytoene synthase